MMLFELTPEDASEAGFRLALINTDLDGTIALMIRFEGKPGTEQVSLIHGPQAELNRAVDDHIAKYRYELVHTFKECPRCGYSVFRNEAPESCPKGCGNLVDAPSPGFREDHIRQEAESALVGPGLLTRKHANLLRQIVTENLRKPFPGQEDVRLTLDEIYQILHVKIRENLVWLAAIATKMNDPIFLGGRTNLLPLGSTLPEKHADYLYVRSKLEALGTWLRGLEYNHAEFAGRRSAYPLTPYRFSRPVELPAVSNAQAKEPQLGVVERKKMRVYTSSGWVEVSSPKLLDAIQALTCEKGVWLSNHECFGETYPTNMRMDKELKRASPAISRHIDSGRPGYRWVDSPTTNKRRCKTKQPR